MNNNHLVIMAGGVGSRFWPMSTPECPKQFIRILATDKTMLQMTVDRFKGIVPISNIWIVTSKTYKDIVKEQLPDLPTEQILLEPCMRNTAPCIAYVAWKIKKRYPEANLVVAPADHIITDTIEFQRVVRESLDFAENNDAILTLGMQPNRPETGYGYIKEQDTIGMIRGVDSFKEKPVLEIAKQYLKEGGYYWNSGIFVWNVLTIERAMRRYQPELALQFDDMSRDFYTNQEQDTIDRDFPKCKSISIDFAIMERADNVFVYPSSFGWSDLGTWGSLYDHLPMDELSNGVVGDNVRMIESSECVVHVPRGKKVVVQGLHKFIIAEHGDTLLICDLNEEQRIKEFSV